MRGDIIHVVLAKKEQNYVNGSCDFCGDKFASHILTFRPQKGLVVNCKEQELKFCDDCFKELQKVVAMDIIRELKGLRDAIKNLWVN